MLKLIIATGEDLVCCIQEQAGQWQATRLTSGRAMRCLAVDSRRPKVLYAGSRGEGVWRSENAGNDWTRLEFPEADVFALAVTIRRPARRTDLPQRRSGRALVAVVNPR